MRKLLSYIILPGLISCSGHSDNIPKAAGNENIKIQRQEIIADSITSVTISFHPFLNNASTLELDRLSGTGLFAVTQKNFFTYGIPDTLRFSLTDMESETVIKSFWNSSFIHSLQQDSSMYGWTDGMPAWIYYTNNNVKDSVYMGNVYTKRVNQILLEKLNYLYKKSGNSAMKAYLKGLKMYLID